MIKKALSSSIHAIPPGSLYQIQKWFAEVITQPLVNSQDSCSRAPSGNLLSEEATLFITPGPALLPHKRIEIYNQQYWWRLIGVLERSFPLLARLFGHSDFSHCIVIPYIQANPSRDWTINKLGSRLPQWLAQTYQETDRDLVLQAAYIDHAYRNSFSAQEEDPLTVSVTSEQELEALLHQPLCLQPYIQLFACQGHFFQFRDAFLLHPMEYWYENEFPPLDRSKNHYFVLFRNEQLRSIWEEISSAEYQLLSSLAQGTSILSACESLALADEEEEIPIESWFKSWTQRKWLCPKSSHSDKIES